MQLKTEIREISYVKDVVSVGPGTSLREVVRKLHEGQFGSIIITEGKKVKGIFTERDYLKKIAGREAGLLDQPISEFMTPEPVCVTENELVMKVGMLMRMGRFRHIVVANEEMELVGIVSIKDVMDFLFDHLTAQGSQTSKAVGWK